MEKSLALNKDKTMMSEFFLFINIPSDIKKLVAPLSQSNMLCQFPWETVYKNKTVYNSRDIY